ncbi:DUF1573 domain-containing protein [bacterium]|nr:DUF1573 domain-containing protein [bacterium]
MKSTTRFFLLLLPAFLILLPACSAQDKADEGDCLHIEGGEIHDFGTINHGEKPTHAFRFTNTCSDTMRFTAVKASCSCTAAMPDDDVLAPGEDTEIRVTFYPPRSSNGHVEKSVSVFVNDEPRPHFVLRIKADIVSGFRTEPEKIEVGSIPVGREAKRSFTITNLGDAPQEIVAVQAVLSIEDRGDDGSGPPVVRPVTTASFSPEKFTLEAGASQEITVRFTPKVKGKLLGSVVVYSGPEARQVEFTGMVE